MGLVDIEQAIRQSEIVVVPAEQELVDDEVGSSVEVSVELGRFSSSSSSSSSPWFPWSSLSISLLSSSSSSPSSSLDDCLSSLSSWLVGGLWQGLKGKGMHGKLNSGKCNVGHLKRTPVTLGKPQIMTAPPHSGHQTTGTVELSASLLVSIQVFVVSLPDVMSCVETPVGIVVIVEVMEISKAVSFVMVPVEVGADEECLVMAGVGDASSMPEPGSKDSRRVPVLDFEPIACSVVALERDNAREELLSVVGSLVGMEARRDDAITDRDLCSDDVRKFERVVAVTIAFDEVFGKASDLVMFRIVFTDSVFVRLQNAWSSVRLEP